MSPILGHPRVNTGEENERTAGQETFDQRGRGHLGIDPLLVLAPQSSHQGDPLLHQGDHLLVHDRPGASCHLSNLVALASKVGDEVGTGLHLVKNGWGLLQTELKDEQLWKSYQYRD